MTKNQVFTGQITGLTSEGLGVARFEDRAVFIKGAIPGEVCEIKLIKITKTAVYGRLEKVITASPHRTPPICPHFGKCGGCDYMHMDYEAETEGKRQRVADALKRIGGIPYDALPITPAPTDAGYRNKAQFPVAMVEGKPEAGFFRQRSHDLIPVEHCHIQPEVAEKARKAVLTWMEKYHILPYDEGSHKGYVRHIFVRTGAVSGQVMVCIVANAEELPRADKLKDILLGELPELTTLVHNVNTRKGNVILGDAYHTIYGEGYIEDTLCGLTFRLSPASFYQVNHHQAQVLYEKAIFYANLHGTETVLDLYCGTGTITLALSRKAGKVIGVEVVSQAIEDAKKNALRNGIENAEFFCADAGEAAQRFQQEGIRPDVIVIDPPRKGVTPQVIDAMVEMAPKRIVYVSCDPATMARDVKMLTEKGYAFVKAEAVDLFPRTKHIESVVLLEAKGGQGRYGAMTESSVKVSMRDDNDLNCSYAIISKGDRSVIIILRNSECAILNYSILQKSAFSFDYFLLKHYPSDVSAYKDFLKLIGKMCKKDISSKYFRNPVDEDNRMVRTDTEEHMITQTEREIYKSRYTDFESFIAECRTQF